MWKKVVLRRVSRAGLDGRRSSSASGSPRGLDKTRRPPLPDVVRKPPRLPFLKCIYAGQYDVETLTYPETLNLERHRDLESRVERLRVTGGSADAVRRLGLFGMSVPYPSSGLDLSDTEIARVFEHVDRGDGFRALFEHTLCADVVKTFGTPGQKSKYLPLFASGAVCSLHDDRRVAAAAATFVSAAPLPDGGWELAGSVRNSAQAYALFVKGGRAYVVDAGRLSADGDVLRLRRTVVRPDDVLDDVDLTAIARRGKLYACAALVASVKELVRSTVANVLPKTRLNMKLRDYDSVLRILARSVINAYTIESMIYLTTWMTDGFRDQDVELETAAVQLFARQTVDTTLAELRMLNGRSSIKEPYSTLFDDVDDMVEYLDGSIELADFISRRGVEFYNKSEYKENVSFLTAAYRNIMMKRNNPSLKYGLQQFLHPALMYSADFLEHCVLKFQSVIDQSHASGRLDPDNEMLMERLSTIIIHIYAMTAVLGRASRSYCTGIRFCDYEMNTAETVVRESCAHVKPILEELVSGKYVATDSVYEAFAYQMLDDNAQSEQTKT